MVGPHRHQQGDGSAPRTRPAPPGGGALASFGHLLEPLQGETGSGPEQQVASLQQGRLLRERIERTLAELNPRYRRAIELRFLQERSRPDCAALLEVKLGTFDVLLLRALRAFRKRWEAQGAAAPAEQER